jgi:microcystin degradation protein MlrC
MTGHDPRVALAGVFHETNTFASSSTDVRAFERRNGWLDHEQLSAAYAGTRTVVGGMLEAAAQHGLDVVPVFGAYATPSGLVTRTAFDTIVDRLCDGLSAAGPWDGLLLELHGAMVVDGLEDPETHLLEQVRAVLDDRPIAAVTDLHANMTQRRVEHLDILVGYRTNPHVDTFESGTDATTHLSRCLTRGQPTILSHARSGVLAAPIAQDSDQIPLLRLLQRARQLERRHRFLDVTVHGGYAFADVPHAGLSFTVTAFDGDQAAAEQAVEELAALGWQHRHEFATDLPDEHTAIERAIRQARDHGGPVVVADTGDNIGGGSPGDGTWLLHALLEAGGPNAATTLCDPSSVDRATAAGIGATVELELGGRGETLGGAPVVAPVSVRALGGGAFTNTGPMAHGARVTMGPVAVVTLGSLDIVLQSQPVQPNDPELFRSVGIEPRNYDLLVLKGAAALRAGWTPLATGFVDAGTRGVTDGDLTRLPYRRLRDVWPLTEERAPRPEGGST